MASPEESIIDGIWNTVQSDYYSRGWTDWSEHMGAVMRKPASYERKYDLLHDGDWFIKRAERDARRATLQFAAILLSAIALVTVGRFIW